MKRILRLTEGDLHRIIKESVRRIIREEDEQHIFYEPQDDGDDECEEWNEAGLNIYDFSMVKDNEIAELHSSPQGYIIYYDGDVFGEAWYDISSRCYRGVSDDDMFDGYKRGFEGASLNGIFMDIMDKAADAILNPEDEDEEYFDDDYDY